MYGRAILESLKRVRLVTISNYKQEHQTDNLQQT